MTETSVLYVCPVIPSLTGNGLAMRAGTVLEVLSRHAGVSLLVVPLYASTSPTVPDPLARLCRQVAFLPVTAQSPASILPGSGRLQSIRQRLASSQRPVPFARARFDIVHLFRLSTLPFAQPYLDGSRGRVTKRCLDFDDFESLTHQRVAALHRANGNDTAAHMEDEQARRSAALEDVVLRHFDRVYVCSPVDRQRLLARSQAEIRVLPNAVRLPAPMPGKPRDLKDRPFTMLFVGTLGYYPNADALQIFCTTVLPALRSMTNQPIRVIVVGTGASEPIHQLALHADIEFAGAVPDIGPYYCAADAVVVPVRAGGGTRIKVLEAFSYGVPVVSTSIGVEGIEARHEEHVLIADSSEAFASACLRLRDDAALAQRLADNALTLVRSAYSIEAIADAFGPPP